MKRNPIPCASCVRWIRLSLLLALAAANALTVRADLVTLANGDRVSGIVEGLAEGKLRCKTDWAGPVEIDWAAVAALDSAETFSVLTTAGEVYTGALRMAESSLIVSVDQTTKTIAARDVASFTPAEKPRSGFWEQLEGGVDLGYSLARGNSSTTQSALDANADYERPKFKVQGRIVSILSAFSGRGASRHALDTRYDRFLSDRSFAFALSGLERNEQQLLNLRAKVGGGFGRKLISTDRTNLSLLGGINFANEKFRSGDGVDSLSANRGEGLAVFDLKTTRWAGIEFTWRTAWYPTLAGRYRIESDSGSRIPLAKNLTWGLSLYARFDSQPPARVKRGDYGLLSTFGYRF